MKIATQSLRHLTVATIAIAALGACSKGSGGGGSPAAAPAPSKPMGTLMLDGTNQKVGSALAQVYNDGDNKYVQIHFYPQDANATCEVMLANQPMSQAVVDAVAVENKELRIAVDTGSSQAQAYGRFDVKSTSGEIVPFDVTAGTVTFSSIGATEIQGTVSMKVAGEKPNELSGPFVAQICGAKKEGVQDQNNGNKDDKGGWTSPVELPPAPPTKGSDQSSSDTPKDSSNQPAKPQFPKPQQPKPQFPNPQQPKPQMPKPTRPQQPQPQPNQPDWDQPGDEGGNRDGMDQNQPPAAPNPIPPRV